jgi:hypothetical protein
MTTCVRLIAAAAVSIAASLPALAEEAKTDSEAQPIPTLHCEFKAVNACTADGSCKAGDNRAFGWQIVIHHASPAAPPSALLRRMP